MVHLYRLALAAVFALCAALSAPAFADGGPFPPTGGGWDESGCNPSAFPVPQWLAQAPNASPSWTCRAEVGNQRPCGYAFTGDGGTSEYVGMCSQIKQPPTCPAGANLITTAAGAEMCSCTAGLRPFNGQCVAAPSCPDGQHEEGGACVPNSCKPNETRVNGVCVPEPPCPSGEVRVNGKCKKADCPAAGTLAGEYMVGSTTPTAMCEGGCTVAISSFMVAYKDGKAASTIGIGYYTGGTCTAPPTSPNPDGGGGGGDGGGTGGTGGEGGGGTGGTGGGTGGTGGGTGGTGGGTGGGGGDKPPVKCPNGDCTGTDGNGPSDGTDPASDGECPPGTYKSGGKCYPNKQPEPPDQDGKCPPGYAKVGTDCVPYKAEDEEDKDDKPSVFGGSCGGFTCDGDAIQCAIAREQHIRACKLFDDESDESRLYKEHKGKTGNQTGDLPGNETISITGRIDTSDAIGGGGCFGDLSVMVWGTSVSLPLSNLCQYLAMLGNILVAVSMLMAARIITRG